ncbi:hypothetical protein [Oenococcus oeni]|uniref:hypothetical protein n=1 Tax=Oenococcus oeni TaxID=1247 RepID=UPI000A63652F|nr:hypothetical protein [Oenococcus oeni]
MANKKKIGLFFGAGAEMGYGLPSGGKFALDIFKMPKQEDKDYFSKMINKIDLQSQIATSNWLPADFKDKRLFVFGKGNFEDIISSSLENRRDSILGFFDNFDRNVSHILANWDIDEQQLQRSFTEKTQLDFGEKLYSQVAVLNDKFAKHSSIFSSEYFSAFLKLIEMFPKEANRISIISTCFLEFLIGSLGEDLVSDLNQQLFKKTPPKIEIFDNLANPFSLNYSATGQNGLAIVLDEDDKKTVKTTDTTMTIFNKLAKDILSNLYAQNLDYQSLIDSHFRYLYKPSSEWAKFTRISIFLYSVRRYIISQLGDVKTIRARSGFYQDTNDIAERCDIKAVGTTNYNNLISQILSQGQKIYKLNGSVDDFYDPYKNTIVSASKKK